MKKIEVYDPALCCPTGVCGPAVDPALVRFAADLEWLKSKGAPVERFNLAQQPAAFAEHERVRGELAAKGTGCLPLVVLDGAIVSQGRYPSRQELAELAGIPYEPPVAGPTLILPMADAGACCPPGDNPSLESDGPCCPWPGPENRGRCC